MSANDQYSPANSSEIRPSTVGWAAAGYLLLTLVYTWPLVLSLSSKTAFLGLSYALFANANLIGEQLAQFDLPLVVPRIFYPVGYTIHEGLLPSVMAWVLGLGRNPVLGLNLSILLSYVLSGLGVFLLALQITRSRWGAFLGGVYFSFSAVHFANLGVYPTRHIEWLAWFLFAMIAYSRSQKTVYLVLLSASFIAASLSTWYFAVFCGLAFGIHWLIVVISERSLVRVLWPSLVLGASCVFLLPLSPPMLLGDYGLVTGGLRHVVNASADLLSFFVPAPRHWYFGKEISAWQQSWPGNPGLRANYFGTLSLLLALSGFFLGKSRERRLRTFYVVLALLSVVLALGPYLAIGGLDGWSVSSPEEPQAMRLPYYWLADHFPFSVTRATSRYSILALLSLAVFLAAGYDLLERKSSRRWWRIVLPLTMGLILVAELSPTWPLKLKAPVPVSAFHAGLSDEPGDFSMLELPYNIQSYRTLYYAQAHDKKVLGGSVDKPYKRFELTIRRYPFFTLLFRASETGAIAPHLAGDVFGEHAPSYTESVLNYLKVRYAAIHPWAEQTLSYGDFYVEEPNAAAMVEAIEPYFRFHSQEKLVHVYERKVGEKWLFPVIGSEWGTLENHQTHVQRALLGAKGTIEIVSSSEATVSIELGLAVILEPERTLEISLDRKEVFHDVLTRHRGEKEDFHTLRLEGLKLKPGSNILKITTPEPVKSLAEVFDSKDQRRISFLLRRFVVVEE